MPAAKKAPAKKAPAKKAAAKKSTASKKTALSRFEESFDKTYGQGRLMTEEHERPYEVISTGSLTLDYALGVGGYVRGRMAELWGPDDAGKTTLAIRGMVEAQRQYSDLLVAFIDVEHRWDWAWARAHGLATARDRFKLVQPDSAEEVADQVKDLCRADLFSMVWVDSIGAMIPEAEKEKDADQAVMMAQAKIVTRMVKIAAVEAHRHGVVMNMINQVRANTNKFAMKKETTGGGFALKHATTHKIELKRGDTFKVGMDGRQQEVGHNCIAMVERNKVATPKQRAEFALFHTATEKYGPIGIDRADEAAIMGIKTGVIPQSGAWFTIPSTGEQINGQPKLTETFRQDPSLVDEVRSLVLATIADRIITGDAAAINLDVDEPDMDLSHLVEGGTGMFQEAGATNG